MGELSGAGSRAAATAGGDSEGCAPPAPAAERATLPAPETTRAPSPPSPLAALRRAVHNHWSHGHTDLTVAGSKLASLELVKCCRSFRYDGIYCFLQLMWISEPLISAVFQVCRDIEHEMATLLLNNQIFEVRALFLIVSLSSCTDADQL